MLKIGDHIPDFSLKDHAGDNFSSNSLAGKKNLVIYFYPGDFTPVCTREACSFRDAYESFLEKDCEIIGISKDSVESHARFKKEKNLPFILLSDVDGTVHQLFGVKGDLFGLIPGRITFVFNKDAKLVYQFDSQLQAEKHVRNSLEALDSL
jgi:peroxiredoxin Q/BCP